MTHKHVLFHSEAREKVLKGAAALTDAVRVTLGPKSKCVLIENRWGKPTVCNDGVTIAKQIELADPEENLGAQMIRQAAERTSDVVGDGTSTATILAYSIFADGLRNIAAGASAIDLKRGLDRGLVVAVETIRGLSRPVESRKERSQIATIAGHNNAVLGELVAEALERVGSDGAISVEEAQGTETQLEVVEGTQFDRGYLSPYFITDAAKMQVVLEEPMILLYDKKISSCQHIVPLLEQLVKLQTPLLVIAEDVESEALAMLVVNKLRGVLACAAVKSPGYGDTRKATMQDLAILTGGRFIADELGVKLDSVKLEDFGRAQRVVIDKDATTLVGGTGDSEAIAARCADIRLQIEKSTSGYDKEKLQQRLAKLSGGVAVIRVGAPSESEMKSRKEALEDSLSATKAAIREGIVPGCGLTLLRAIASVEAEEQTCDGDQRTGLRMLKRALEAPTRQIAENSSADGGVIVSNMRAGTGNYGFDAATGQYVDLVEHGIIDPTEVVRTALENAVSVAGVLLLTEATLTEVREPREERHAAGDAFGE